MRAGRAGPDLGAPGPAGPLRLKRDPPGSAGGGLHSRAGCDIYPPACGTPPSPRLSVGVESAAPGTCSEVAFTILPEKSIL